MSFPFPKSLFLGCSLLLLAACRHEPNGANQDDRITIAVAANMQFAMEELTEAFSRQTGIACQMTISSSGKLTAQIKEGAPFDVFVSANMKYPEEIRRSGLAATPPQIYAYGKLVLWTMQDDLPPSLDILTDPQIRHIALANTRTAPYGMAAMALLQNLQLLDQVTDKLVYGESIAQTNQFVITGAAEVGFTAMSVVLSPQLKRKGRWVAIDPSLYPPIEQGVVVIQHDDGPKEQARKFYEFLFSPEAQSILTAFGYAVEAAPPAGRRPG